MILSMTGFAAVAAELPGLSLAVELRSVNHRYLDVTVKLPNKGVTAHNFSIDALSISVDLAPGESKDVVVNAPAGTYEFYCNVPGHKEAGMVGTLTVK